VSYDSETGLGRVQSATPELKPAYTKNYDLSAEWYVEPAGVVSASLFRKDISDFIARETTLIGAGPGNGFGGLYEDFELNTTANAGDATVEGYELNFVHQFTWLPKPLNGLALHANYTRTKTSGSYESGEEELIAFIPRMANVGLSGRYGKFEGRVSYNFKGGYLRAYNANPDLRSRTTDVGTWDFNLQYGFHRRLTVFVDVVNAFNEWESWYNGRDELRVTMAEVYGTRLNIGISGRF
jgi:TonB-dependent receptor